jgi:MFS family permease
MTGVASAPAPTARELRRLAMMVLIVGVLMNLLARGLAESFAVFLLPLGEAFQSDRAAVTAIYSSYMLVYGFAAPFSGALIDKLGSRVCYAIGLALFALAYALASQATALWQLYLLIGLLSGIASSALGMVPASVLASRWFDRRLPTAISFLYASLGVGVLMFSPLTQWLIEGSGWRGAYRWLAVAPVLLLPLTLLLPWRKLLAGNPEVIARRPPRARIGMRAALASALRARSFWALFGVMFFTSVTTYSVQVQLVAFLVESGFEPLLAASVYGLVGVLSIVGMMAAGLLAERFGERLVATLSYSCTLAGLLCLGLLAYYPGVALLGAFVLLFGSVSGSRGPLVAVLSSRLFPGEAQATVYGFVLTGMGTGGALAAWLAGALHDWTGNYQAGFVVAGVAAVAGLSLFRSIESLSAQMLQQR